MSDREIETIENRLLDLAIEGDREAARHYADLYLFRRNWERARSAEHRQHLVHQAQDAGTWLTGKQEP